MQSLVRTRDAPRESERTERGETGGRGGKPPGVGRQGARELLHLQRTAGNQAVRHLVRHLVRPGGIQAKLRVNRVGDSYEREADRVADRVVPGGPDRPTPSISRGPVQVELAPWAAGHVRAALRGGRSLTPAERGFFAPRMGAELDGVRVHDHAAAATSAALLGARAYAYGGHVVLGRGEYDFGRPEGKRLMAHELAHVLQQRGGTGGAREIHDGPGAVASSISRTRRPTIQRQNGGGTRTAPTRAEAERTAREFQRIAQDADSVDEFSSSVEAAAADALGAINADAVVFSVSGAAGYWAGVGGGLELLYSPRFGWASYLQLGAGVVTPGGSIAFEVGVIWDLGNPRDYTGSFIELAGSDRASGSVSVTPADVGEALTEGTMSRPRGVKVGGAIGSPGAALLYEYYWQISGIEALPDVVHRGYHTFYLPSLLGRGRREGFVAQLHMRVPRTRNVALQVAYQRAHRRTQVSFDLASDETLNPALLSSDDHRAVFDLDGDREADLEIFVPGFVLQASGGGLQLEIIFRGRTVQRLTFPRMGTLSNGKEYFRIPGTEHLPTGIRFIDEDGRGVNPARP